MKRFLIFLLAICMLVGIACTDKGDDNAASDPNLGLYTATSAEMWGIEMSVEDVLEKGVSIELKANGKCAMSVDGKTGNGKWTLDGTSFSVSGGGLNCKGTLSDGVMKLENVLDMGVSLTLVNEDFVPAQNGGNETTGATEAPAVKSNEFWIVAYTANGQTYEGEYLKDTGMDQTYLILNDDHTGTLSLSGEVFEIGWTNEGNITVAGMPMYPFSYEDEDTIKLSFYDTIFYTLKRGANAGAAQEPAGTDPEPATAPETENPGATEEPSATDEPAKSGTATYPGAPYGSSDGIISHDKLAGLYRWLSDMPSEFRSELTFDDIGNAVGKQGFDKQDNDGKYHAAYWYDGEKYYVTVTFYNREDVWTCGSITTGIPSSEYSEADISGFPKVGSSTPAGTNPTAEVALETKGPSNTKITVKAQVPTVGWFPESKSSEVRYFSAPNEKKKSSSSPSIRVEFKESLDKIDFYKSSFENLTELGARTIAGVEMQGRSYKYVGMNWIEFYGQIADGVWASVKLTGVDFSAGTETEAIVNSLTFGVENQ